MQRDASAENRRGQSLVTFSGLLNALDGVAGALTPGGTVTVASVTGVCTGADDGSSGDPTTPVACATNAGGTGCAVAGGDCVFGATAMVLDSAQVSHRELTLYRH